MPAIVQPVMWSFADALSLVPHPDYLVVADDINDYHHQIPVPKNMQKGEIAEMFEEEDKVVHVVNPGNFSIGKTFVTIYPTLNQVEPCDLNN